MWCAAPSYLVSTNVGNSFSKKEKGLFLVSFWAIPIFYLLLGARFSLMYHMIVFFVDKAKGVRFKLLKKRLGLKNKHILIGIISLVFFGYLLSIVFQLFANRGNTDIFYQFLNYYGDMKIRPYWEKLFFLSDETLAPVFKVFQYFGHSIPNLCYSLSVYNHTYSHTYGLVFFSFLRYFLILFGNSDTWIKLIILSYPGSGSYGTFLYDLLIDWGVVFAPLFCFFIGFFFSLIERNADNSNLAKTVYPIAWACMFFAPIGGIWVSSSQMNVLILFMYYFLFKLVGAWA